MTLVNNWHQHRRKDNTVAVYIKSLTCCASDEVISEEILKSATPATVAKAPEYTGEPVKVTFILV